MEYYQVTLLLGGIICFLLYKIGTSTYKFFEEKGIPYEKPVPFVGNLAPVLLRRIPIADNVARLYNKYKSHRAFGGFEMMNPQFNICDPHLIRQIGIKDFDHFVDHRQVLHRDAEPVLSRSLFSLTGYEWREMRATLSPAFTGNKMRTMFALIKDSSENLVKAIQEMYDNQQSVSKSESFILEAKDIYTKFTNDIIASAAFGLKIDTIKNPDNDFYKLGKKFSKFDGFTMIRFLIVVSFYRFAKFFNIRIFPAKALNYFCSIVLNTIKYREENDVHRPDMINLLIQAKKGKLTATAEDIEEDPNIAQSIENQKKSKHLVLDDNAIVSQCVLFFVAGFETTATVMSFATHEICVNPEVQKKLIEEIDAVNESRNGNPVTYDIIKKMKYLDMVLSESLRMWPPAFGTDRQCTKDYTFTDYDGKEILIKKGDVIGIPIFGIHRDEQYFPNPMKFDPERFSDENRESIDPCTYMPFGVGPRFCIGNRFAMLEIKTLLFHLLSHFTFEPCEKTQIPLKLQTSGISFMSEKGFWIQMKPRFPNKI